MHLGPIKARVPLGSVIRLHLRSGSVLEGELRDIDESCLVIDSGSTEMILEAHTIDLIERLGASTTAAGASDAGPPVPAVREESPPVVPQPAEPSPVELPAGARARLEGLVAAALALPTEIAAPTFAFDTAHHPEVTAAHVRTLARSIGDRYVYGVRIKEADRVLDCVDKLRRVDEKYDLPDALQTAGRMAWRLGRKPLALELFADAADRLNDDSSCFDLGMAQQLTDEVAFATSTFASSVHEGTDPADAAYLALVAALGNDGQGRDSLVELLTEAAEWPPGPGRLAVLHMGLLFADRARLHRFPLERWMAPDLPEDAFATVAAAVVGPIRASTPFSPGARTAPPPRPATPTGAAPDPRLLAPKPSPGPAGKQRIEPAPTRPRSSTLVASYASPPAGSAPPNLPADTERSGSALLARAEKAAKQQDHETARRLLKRAIDEKLEPATAVLRLATLHANLRERDAALALLEEQRHLYVTKAARYRWLQHRSTILEHAGRWEEAADELRDMLTLDQARGEDRMRLVSRLGVALLKSFQYPEAEQLVETELRMRPKQTVLKNLRDELRQARDSGVYTSVEARLQTHTEQPVELSSLLKFHLDRCEYRGVRADRVANRNFAEEDIKRLDDLVSGRRKDRALGSDTPRERADYNLSAAKIMQDLGIADDRFHSRLRYFAAAMGDACAVEGRVPSDVVRAYYAESIGVKREWDDLVDVKLRQLVLSFTRTGAQLTDMGQLPALEAGLTSAMRAEHLVSPVLVSLLGLPTTGDVAARLIRRIWQDQVTRDLFRVAIGAFLGLDKQILDQRTFTSHWLDAAKRVRERREEVVRRIGVLSDGMQVDLGVVNQQKSELDRIAREMAQGTDQNRVIECQKLVTEIGQYVEQSVYVERERVSGNVTRAIRSLTDEIERTPTVLSIVSLRPYLDTLASTLTTHFTAYQRAAEPENLTVELVVDRYLPDGGRMDVQMEVSNAVGASPVSNVVLNVLASRDYTASSDPVPVSASIAAGESQTCTITLHPTAMAIEQQLITLLCQVSFTSRTQKPVSAPVEPHSIRLHAGNGWIDIPNPYTVGPPIKESEMFFGRDHLVANLAAMASGNDLGSIVVFGQKRAGKSSVLYHLETELEAPVLAVPFSMPETSGSVTFADVLYKIGAECHFRIESRIEDLGSDLPPPPAPDLQDIRLAPQQKFIEHMRRLHRWLRKSPGFADSRIVLLIDEFTVIHKHIRNKSIPDDFMKGWKAMLEAGLFRCVLVGNDLMPAFISDFPNEFQVARQERLSYLDAKSATDLIERPILLDGRTRYRGNAVERILELTGRSPYYIQLFCQRLVTYMNSEEVRGLVIGPADVESVADLLVRGREALSEDQFDNLLTPGDKDVTDISSDTVKEVLQATAKDRGRDMYHEARGCADPNAEMVLQDLVSREVLERMSGNRYRIRVGLFREWLQHRWT